MTNDNRFLDDMARMAGGAASLLSTVRRQIRADLKDKVDSYTSRMDIAEKRELERLRAMVTKFRLEQEEMKERIEALEASLSGKAAKTAKKPTASPKKKTTSRNTKRK